LVRPVSVGGVDGIVSGNPAYARIGFGTSINLGSNEHNVDLILFKAADDEDSIEPPPPETGITPAENLVLGFVTTHQFAKKFFFDLEYAFSAFTTDTRGEEVVLDKFSYTNNLDGLFTPNASSQFNKAILTNLAYKGQGYQLKLTYRRLDPEYKTMGSVFLANDLEDISLNTSWAMFKNKATFSVSGGFQHNNLNDEQIATLTRLISSFAVSYSFNQNLNVSANYANFNSSTELSPILLVDEFGNPDSLNYVQTTNSAGLSFNYIANPGSSVQNVFFVSGNYQGADDTENMASRFYNFNATHQITFSLLNASISTSFNYNDNRVGEVENQMFGPTIAFIKTFLDRKVRGILSYGIQTNRMNNQLEGVINNIKIGSSVKVGKRHNIAFDMTYLTRNGQMENSRSFNETRGSLSYNVSF